MSAPGSFPLICWSATGSIWMSRQQGIQIPALWLEFDPQAVNHDYDEPAAYREIKSHKTLVWLAPSPHIDYDRTAAFTRWLDGLVPVLSH